MARNRKRPGLKTVAKCTKPVREIKKKAAQPPEEILFRVEGKMSTFGGPHDFGMAADEDLALLAMTLHPATADPAEPVAPTVSLAQCTRKQLSLLGWKRMCEWQARGSRSALTRASHLLRDCFLFSNP